MVYFKTIRTCFGQLLPDEFQYYKSRVLDFVLLKATFLCAVLKTVFSDILVWCFWFTFIVSMRSIIILVGERSEAGIVSFHEHHLASTQARVQRENKLVQLETPKVAILYICMTLCAILSCELICPNIIWGILNITNTNTTIIQCTWFVKFDFSLTSRMFLLFDTLSVLLLGIKTTARNLLAKHCDEDSDEILFKGIYIISLLHYSLIILHYLHILNIRGISLTLLDTLLFLQIRSVFKEFRNCAAKAQLIWAAYYQLHEKSSEATVAQLKQVDFLCAICRDSMLDGKILHCGHIFHAKCIRNWIAIHHTCPICRENL